MNIRMDINYGVPAIPFLKYIIYLIVLVKNVHANIDERALLHKLFTNYSTSTRPATSVRDSVHVTFGLTLSQIIDVEEKNQILIISAWTRQLWRNPLLTWDPKKHNNIKQINVEPKDIWKPDIVLYNNADEDKSYGGNLDKLNTRAILHYDGNTTWLAPIILKSKCKIDVTYFPFDTQNCHLKFGSWTYDEDRLNLTQEQAGADLGMYTTNAEWKLNHATAKRNTMTYTCCPGVFPDVTFEISLARRSLFYLLNLIFPMIIIGMLTLCSFLLPAESGERMGLAVTLLLAMTVFMLLVTDIIPATSDGVPLVGIFFNASIVEMVIMIIVLCYIMRLYHKDSDDPPMPLWARRIILDWLSYKVGSRTKGGKNKKIDKKMPSLQNDVVLKNLQTTPIHHNGNVNTPSTKLQNVETPREYEIIKRSGSVGNNKEDLRRFPNFLSENEVFLRKLDGVRANVDTSTEIDESGNEKCTNDKTTTPSTKPGRDIDGFTENELFIVTHSNTIRNRVGNVKATNEKTLENEVGSKKTTGQVIHSKENNVNTSRRQSMNIPKGPVFLKKIDIIIKRFNDHRDENIAKREWVIVANTINRCFSIKFLVVLAITIIGCFAQAPYGYVN